MPPPPRPTQSHSDSAGTGGNGLPPLSAPVPVPSADGDEPHKDGRGTHDSAQHRGQARGGAGSRSSLGSLGQDLGQGDRSKACALGTISIIAANEG